MNRSEIGRLVLATTIWRRPFLTDIVLGYYRRVREALKDQMDLTLLAVGSEGAASRELCENNGFKYIETENEPVTYKWNAVIRVARAWEPDGVILVNSDDIVSANLFEVYLERLSDGHDYFGLRDSFIFDLMTGTLGRWPGYEASHMQYRVGEPAGCARCFSRRLLETTGWRLWPTIPPRNSRMDFWCTQYLSLFGYNPLAFTMASLEVLAFQLKTDVNITPFEVIPLTEVCARESAWKALGSILDTGELAGLRSLRGSYSQEVAVPPSALPDRFPDSGEERIHDIMDLKPVADRDQLLSDLSAMRRNVEEERRLGTIDAGVAELRLP